MGSRLWALSAAFGCTALVASIISMTSSNAATTDPTFSSPVCKGTSLVRSGVKNLALQSGETIRFSIYTSTATSKGKAYHAFCGSAELVGASTSKTIKAVDVNLTAGSVTTTKQSLHTGTQGSSRVWGGKQLLSNGSPVSLSFAIHFVTQPALSRSQFLTVTQAQFGKAAATPSVAAAGKIVANAGPDQTVPLNTLVHLDGSKSVLAAPGPTTATGSVAQTGLGGRVYSTGKPVTVTVEDSEAGFTTELWLLSPVQKALASNRDTGQTVSVGTFPSGAELVFGIRYNPSQFADMGQNPEKYNTLTAVQFETGPGTRNPDTIPHVQVTSKGPGEVLVGFEDIIDGGDKDYNDNQFDFKGGVTTGAPGAAGLQWSIVSQTGPPVQLSSTTDISPTFNATGAGTYTFRLTLTSGSQTQTDDVVVVVKGPTPTRNTT